MNTEVPLVAIAESVLLKECAVLHALDMTLIEHDAELPVTLNDTQNSPLKHIARIDRIT